MHDKCVGKFWAVIEVEESLSWLYISWEISNVHISYLSNKSSEAIRQKSFDKEIMMCSDQLRHHYSSWLPNHVFFRYVKYLASCLIAVDESTYFFIQQDTIFKGKDCESNIINVVICDAKSTVLLLHVFDHKQVSQIIDHLVVRLSIVE